jgi:uridine monophosphate synthetase
MEVLMGFFSRLERRARQVESILCIGLDPHVEDLTAPTTQAVQDFCLELIERTHETAAAYKPNIAFFEVFGPAGISTLKFIIDSIPDDIPVILDAKRGDIASSAQAYATSVFETLAVDAVTVNPYLGYDSIIPFLENENRGVFLLCKTSNPGAADIQDRKILTDSESPRRSPGITVFELVAKYASTWNKMDNLGLVVGAIHPEALRKVRTQAPDLWILAPGVGAQGADVSLALQAGLREDGLGMLIPVSRGISRADNPRNAAIALCENINQARRDIKPYPFSSDKGKSHSDPELDLLACDLLKAGCVKFGDFRLKSGLSSPIYIDLRRLVGYPPLLDRVAEAFVTKLSQLTFDHLAAIPYAALPIATAISLQSGWSLIYPRKEVKSYGTQAKVEGVYTIGEKAVLIDDLATTGGSKFEAIEKLEAAGLVISDVVVLIDRQSGSTEALKSSGYEMHAIFSLTQMLTYWSQAGLVTSDQEQAVGKFLTETGSSDVR